MVFVPNLVEGELPLEGAEIEEASIVVVSRRRRLRRSAASPTCLTTYHSPLTTTHYLLLTTYHSLLTTTYYSLIKERRLAYVALSRAKTKLYVSHAARDASGQPTTPSRFLRVCHAGLEPQASRQGPRQVCCSHVRALAWSGAACGDAVLGDGLR